MLEMTKARRFTQGMMIFWNIITYCVLTLFVLHTVTTQPALFATWRGWLFGALVVMYGVWYLLGFRWLLAPPHVWQERSLGRRAAYWLPLALLPLALLPFDPLYVNMEWIAIGCGMGILLPPWNILGVGAALTPLILSWGIWPRANTSDAWLQFAVTLLTIVIYCAIIYLPSVLVAQRFKLTRLYVDLQTAHADLAAAHAQLAESAAHERELAVLRERERLARDMHDTLGHALALTTVKIEAIRRLSAIDPERAAHEMDATEAIVCGAMGELRATLVALRSSPCLATALTDHATAIGERAGLRVTCECAAAAETWDPTVQEALLRIGMEALTNVERHAHAHQLTLTLTDAAGMALLCVADDGVGLPPLPIAVDGSFTSPPGHFGLTGMHERVTALGGSLTITSAPGMGTTVEARLPLHATSVVPAPATQLLQVR